LKYLEILKNYETWRRIFPGGIGESFNLHPLDWIYAAVGASGEMQIPTDGGSGLMVATHKMLLGRVEILLGEMQCELG
jgi:hypothetical protein